MIVGLITELSIVGVFSRGVGNEERIVFRATEMVQMGQYGLMIGVRLGQGFASPVRDNFLWFGDAILNKGLTQLSRKALFNTLGEGENVSRQP